MPAVFGGGGGGSRKWALYNAPRNLPLAPGHKHLKTSVIFCISAQIRTKSLTYISFISSFGYLGLWTGRFIMESRENWNNWTSSLYVGVASSGKVGILSCFIHSEG